MSHHRNPDKSLRIAPFTKWGRSKAEHHLFLAGLIVIGVAVIFSLLMADLHRGLLGDSKGGSGVGSSRALGDISNLRESGRGACREPLPTKAPIPDSAQAAGELVDHPKEIPAVGESAPIMGSERVSSSGSERVQASAASSPFRGSGASARDAALVLGERLNEPGVPDTHAGSGPDGDILSKQEQLLIPIFYSLKASQFDHLPPEQQQAVASLQNEFIAYHREWADSSSQSITDWNERMREFHLDLVRRIGAPAADALTR